MSRGASSLAAAVFQTLARRPALFLPQLFIGFVEWTAFAFVFAGPAAVVDPPVRAFLGDIYLHGPFRFLLLLHVLRPVELIAGWGLSPWAAGTVASLAGESLAPRERRASFFAHVGRAARRYFACFIVVGMGYLLSRGLFGLAQKALLNAFGTVSLVQGLAIFSAAGYFVTLLTQGPLIYGVPALMEGETLGRALKRSVALAARRWGKTALILTGPTLVVLATEVLMVLTPALMRKVFPEMALWALLARVILAGLAETVLVTAATLFFKFRARENESPRS